MELSTVGKVITPRELKARWSFGELRSRRFADSYRGLVPSSLFDAAVAGRPFETLTSTDIELLADALVQHLDRGGLAVAVGAYDDFECSLWTAEQLRRVVCVPGLGWMPLAELLHPKTPAAAAIRNAIDGGTPPSGNFRQDEPIVVLPSVANPEALGRPLLLEGTGRSLWFLTRPPTTGMIAVWVGRSTAGA